MCLSGARTLATLRARVRAVGVAAALQEVSRRRRGLAVVLDRLQSWRTTPPRVTTLLEIVASKIHGHLPHMPAESHDDERDRRAEDVATLLTLAISAMAVARYVP